MAYENLIFEKKDGLAFITINKPQVLNALNHKTMDELRLAFLSVKEDADIRAVIITGAGEKAFVAGADINEIAQCDYITGRDFALKGQHIFWLIENCGKPVIAAVNGFALGGGCELTLACTIRIASEKAKFGQPEINLGIIPGYGGTQRLSRLVGKGIAMELILGGNMIDAQEAYRIGLVNKIVKPEELLAEAEKMARLFMSKSPVTVRLALEAVNKGMEMTQFEGSYLEASFFGHTCATEDMKEGTKAFLEKRKPEFKGK